MPLTKRDKAIIEDLNRFRVMDRDSIAEIHFKGLKNPRYAANNVLLRLLRDGHIQRSTAFVPYVYFGPDVSMKKNSAKIGHFLAIVDVYKEIMQHGKVDTFLVEPKYGKKGTAEPDIFCLYRRTPFFIEVQKTIYSEKQMSDKLSRYVDLFESGLIAGETWQRPDKKVFPHVLIISEQRYAVDTDYPFRVIQAPSFNHFLQSLKPKESTERKGMPSVKSENGQVKIRVN
ncbi:replication-relaxation family protein [Metabacillus litoralis]|uniref:replication-relaxation family protein n=1 Tax=Metabacillus litoralis TaxID=152268 RepID=UPI00203B0AEE|nr:replication-relaxation family protein [Metabacillus litoralis]MCM3165105.1 replication-relaxation family protein [Metabacillus litoralis]